MQASPTEQQHPGAHWMEFQKVSASFTAKHTLFGKTGAVPSTTSACSLQAFSRLQLLQRCITLAQRHRCICHGC